MSGATKIKREKMFQVSKNANSTHTKKIFLLYQRFIVIKCRKLH